MHVDVCIRLILPGAVQRLTIEGLSCVGAGTWIGAGWEALCRFTVWCFREEDGALRGRVLAQNSERAR